MALKEMFNIRSWRPSWISRSTAATDSTDLLIDPEKQPYSDSPPISPIRSSMNIGLPKSRTSLCNRCMQLLVWSTIVTISLWAVGAVFFGRNEFKTSLNTMGNKPNESDVEHWSTIPEKSRAVFFKDSQGQMRWSISISKAQTFPLAPDQLADICSQADRLPHHLHPEHGHMAHFEYYHLDPDYMQVSEAISSGILPSAHLPHPDSVVDGIQTAEKDSIDESDPATGICKRSLTFAMQSTDAGLGRTLMSLWLAYGLAKYEKRAFFIDDRNWAYGSWSTFFAPPPAPACKPVPEMERVPCPHQADHLLVSTATTSWLFGHGFEEEFEDPRKMEVQRQIRIFNMIRQGYEALFHLSSEDAVSVADRVRSLNTSISPGLSVGIHIRHGDKHPYTQRFSKTYIPPAMYVDAANEELFKAFNNTDESASNAIAASRMILASDDAAVYNYWEEGDILRAQDRVVLETPSTSSISGAAGTLPLPFEGGFFGSKFSEIKGQAAWFSSDPSLDYRAMLARSYLMDLAVLGSTDRVVCTVSSTGCRLLAVMMGWDKAIVRKQWVNVDGDFDWQGVRW